MKNVLCLLSNLPYQGSAVTEKLDAAMVCAAFDMPTQLLFVGDGVFALLQEQVAEHRSVAKMLRALPSYEIDQIFVCAESLQARGLTTDQISELAAVVTMEEQKSLLATADLVLS